MRVLGFTLIAVSIVGTILAFTFAADYVPQRGFVRNLSESQLFPIVRRVQEPCPEPAVSQVTWDFEPAVSQFTWHVPMATDSTGCPLHHSDWTPESQTRPRTVVRFAGVPLGVALAITGVVGLTGIGLAVFGRKPV